MWYCVQVSPLPHKRHPAPPFRAVFLGQLWYMSYAILGENWEALLRIYTTQHSYTDFTPNWGVHWYLFQQMFSDLRYPVPSGSLTAIPIPPIRQPG